MKSVIVYGPQGCGKTRNAERIAKHFGLRRIKDGGKYVVFTVGVLYLTSDEAWAKTFNGHARVMSFDEVMQQIESQPA